MAHPIETPLARSRFGAAAAVIVSALGLTTIAEAANPPIRISQTSRVPACVTPDRLMQFLKTRNNNLDPRFKDIAKYYKLHGDAWKVRWDYAFYQMAIETNFLTYRAPGGRMGDVQFRQNNFAGIGTTGGGVPGDSYPDVSTGVLAQIQHLVVYAGERIDKPVAPRTQLKQPDILALSMPIVAKRPVTFQDLSGRWAVDKAYGRSIQWVADRYQSQFCPNGDLRADASDTAGDSAAPAAKTLAVAAIEPAKTTAEPDTEQAADEAPGQAGKIGLGGKKPKLDSKRRSQAFAAANGGGSNGKSGLAGPAKTRAKPKAEDDDGGIGIAKTAAPLPEGPGAEIARKAIEEQRSTANSDRSGLGAGVGGWAVPALAPVAGTSVSAPDAQIAPQRCRVFSASYGGRRTVIVKSEAAGQLQMTLLTVLDGFEKSLTDSFLKTQAPGAVSLGVFDSSEDAMKRVGAECGTANPG